jgi:cytochrome P450
MLGAGHETTALTLTWAFYYLSKHPVWRRAVRREAETVLERRSPRFDDLSSMPLCRGVIEEVMRVRPSLWAFGRTAVASDVLRGVRIPPGAQVMLCPYLTHRHPEFWPNAEGFDPERFTTEIGAPRHPFANLPFGGGPRKCMGAQFAMMEMQLVLSLLARDFDVDLVPGREPAMQANITLRARDGLWATLRRPGA